MGLFHAATLTPTKVDLITSWLPTRPWAPSWSGPVEVVGTYRIDDPYGRVGMEVFLIRADDVILQVPLTYRNEPLADDPEGLIGELQHSALGTRWVYDGLRDPLFVTMLAAVTMTGQGEALGMVDYDGRMHIAPTNIRIHGGGWTLDRVPVDRFQIQTDDVEASVLYNDQFELTVYRRPTSGVRTPMTLSATWDGSDDALILAAVRTR